jgi:hypothetical protein
MIKLTLSHEELEKIAHRYTHQVDKYSRMFAGLSTELVRYVDGIIYIEISNSQQNVLSTYNTAVAYAISYKKSNPELKEALGFVVIFYDRENIPGFHITKNTHNEQIQELVNQLRKPENPSIRTVYANMFCEEMESVNKDLVRNN